MIKVAVLYGGPSSAYADSLKSGNFVSSILRESEEYEPVEIFISREGDWHYKGLVEDPHRVLSRADVAWNALHGDYGESGHLQNLLKSLCLPYVGSYTIPSLFAHDKELTKKLYKDHSLPVLGSEILREDELNDERLIQIFTTYLPPVIVKPATGVRGLGVRFAYTFQELKDVVKNAFIHSPKAMIEEYVRGTIVSSHVIENARGEELYTLMPVALETELRRVRPTPDQNKKIGEMTKQAHEALGLRHYSQSDFIITPSGKIFILETNSSPVFHEDSLLHQSLLSRRGGC